MKTNFFYIGLTSLLLVICSCKDDYDPYGNFQPSLSPHYLFCDANEEYHCYAEAYTGSFYVESFKTTWEFSDVPNWISVSPQYGNASASITIKVQANNSGDRRTATFFFKATDPDCHYRQEISITQESFRW